MTGWEFTKQYLSPFMFVFRLLLLMGALLAGFFSFIMVHQPDTGIKGGGFIGLIMAGYAFWSAIRPWKLTNWRNINKKLDEMNK